MRENQSCGQNEWLGQTEERLKAEKTHRRLWWYFGWKETKVRNRKVALRMGKKEHVWETLSPPLVNRTFLPTPGALDTPKRCQVEAPSSIEAQIPLVPEVGSAFSYRPNAICKFSTHIYVYFCTANFSCYLSVLSSVISLNFGNKQHLILERIILCPVWQT